MGRGMDTTFAQTIGIDHRRRSGVDSRDGRGRPDHRSREATPAPATRAADARARRADERGRRDRAGGRRRPQRRRSRPRSTQIAARLRAAGGSSTSAPARPGGSPRSTPPSARRPSPRRPGSVVALVAGGDRRRRRSPRRPPRTTATPARRDVEALGVGTGRRRRRHQRERPTPYVLGALEAAARRRRAHRLRRLRRTARELGALAEHEIVVVVGPEFLAGSTRLKAGTAQKLVLNTISTISMIRLGKTYGNLMVDVVAANEKLAGAVRRIVARGDRRLRRRRSTTALADAGRRREGRDRLAARAASTPRRARRAPRRRRRSIVRRAGGRVVRLGVEAALVDGTLVPGDVEIVDGRIAGFGLASPNGRGIAVARLRRPPGERLRRGRLPRRRRRRATARAGEALLETGVTAYLPTLITAPEEQLLAALREIPRGRRGPRILGAHLEGPFLSALRLGTHPPAARRQPGPRPARAAPRRGARPARHARAGAPGRARARRAARRARRSPSPPATRTRPPSRRTPPSTAACGPSRTSSTRCARSTTATRAIAGAALARPDVVVQIILDWVHLAPDTVRARLAGRAGPPRARHRRGRRRRASATARTASATLDVEVRDGVVRGDDGVLAGSALTMIEAVRNLHALGVPLEDALDAATEVPARVLGCRRRAGSRSALPPTSSSSSDELEIERVLVGGRGACRRLSRRCRRAEPGLAVPRRRSASSRPRSSACSSSEPSSRASRPRCASAARRSSAWSGTARPTTPRRTASTRSACCRAGPRCATRSRLTVYYGAELDMSGSTVIALSQSGRTPDVVEYVRQRAAPRARSRVAVTNDAASELARAADAVLPLAAGAGARGRGDEDVPRTSSPRSASSPRMLAGRGRRVRGRHRASVADRSSGSSPRRSRRASRRSRSRSPTRADVRRSAAGRSSRPRARSRSSCSRPAGSPRSR